MNGAVEVEWLPSLIVGAIGIVVGAVLVWRQLATSTSRRAAAGNAAAEVRDLAVRSEALLRQLRELDDTASKRTPAQLARERYALELEAATALLALEDKAAAAGPAKAITASLTDSALASSLLAGSTGANSTGANSASANSASANSARPKSALADWAQGNSARASAALAGVPAPTAVEMDSAGRAPAPGRDRAALRGFAWGAGSATALLLLAFYVYQSAAPRGAGGSVTGNIPGEAAAGNGSMAAQPPGATPESNSAEEAGLQAALARNPDDLESRLSLTRLYVERENWMGVWNETGRVLAKTPNNPRALAYQSLVRLSMGQADLAVTMLNKAIAADPDFIDAYAYLALVYARTGRMRDAETALAKGSQRFPDRAADFRGYLADLRKQEQAPVPASTAAGAANPHAGLGAPADAARSAGPPARSGAPAARNEARTAQADARPGRSDAAPQGAAGARVAGTIDLDPSLRDAVPPGAVLFVFVRAAGVTSGPPVAAKRLPPVFPATFDLSQADSMMGQPFPDSLLIEARLDTDGDPTTRPDSDPKDRLEGVQVGRTDLHLLLKRR